MRQGAVDYIPKPFDHDEMLMAVERVLKEGRLNRGNQALRRDIERTYPVHNMVGDSEAMQELKHRIARVGPHQYPGPDHGRGRHRQGTDSPRPARAQRAQWRPPDHRALRRPAQEPAAQ